MPELLTVKDVELKVFKRVMFRGYSVQDVEEFLEQVVRTFDSYDIRHSEQQRRIHELEAALKRHEVMKNTI